MVDKMNLDTWGKKKPVVLQWIFNYIIKVWDFFLFCTMFITIFLRKMRNSSLLNFSHYVFNSIPALPLTFSIFACYNMLLWSPAFCLTAVLFWIIFLLLQGARQLLLLKSPPIIKFCGNVSCVVLLGVSVCF